MASVGDGVYKGRVPDRNVISVEGSDREYHRLRILFVLLLPLAMSLMAVSSVNVVLHTLETGLGASATDLQWVLSGYALAFGISLRLSPVPRGRDNLAELGAVVLLKLGLMPAVAGLVAGPLMGLPGPEVLAVVVMSTLPTAQNVFVLAVAYGRGEDIARDSVFATTVLAAPAMVLVVALLGGG